MSCIVLEVKEGKGCEIVADVLAWNFFLQDATPFNSTFPDKKD